MISNMTVDKALYTASDFFINIFISMLFIPCISY